MWITKVVCKVSETFTNGKCWIRIYIAFTIFQSFREVKAGDIKSLEIEWWDLGSNPKPLVCQTKSLTTTPQLVLSHMGVFSSPEPKAQVSYCHSSLSVVIRRRPSIDFHIFNFFSRIASWILMKLGIDEVLMVSYKCCCFSAGSTRGGSRAGQKEVMGVPFFKKLLLQTRKLQQQTKCIAMI